MRSRILTAMVVALALILPFGAIAQDILEKFSPIIDKGEFRQAQAEMRQELATNLEMVPLDRLALEFEIERLDRIRKDFTETREEVVIYQAVHPRCHGCGSGTVGEGEIFGVPHD